jgi:hypothetical protein
MHPIHYANGNNIPNNHQGHATDPFIKVSLLSFVGAFRIFVCFKLIHKHHPAEYHISQLEEAENQCDSGDLFSFFVKCVSEQFLHF